MRVGHLGIPVDNWRFKSMRGYGCRGHLNYRRQATGVVRVMVCEDDQIHSVHRRANRFQSGGDDRSAAPSSGIDEHNSLIFDNRGHRGPDRGELVYAGADLNRRFRKQPCQESQPISAPPVLLPYALRASYYGGITCRKTLSNIARLTGSPGFTLR